VALAIILSLGWESPSSAQSQQRIAAIVNDEIISGYDLTSRINLVILSSVIVMGPPLLIWLMKRGITEPFEAMTFPNLTTANFVLVTPL